MNELEKERYNTFSPKPDWRLGVDRKITGETQRYTKISHKQVIFDSKNNSLGSCWAMLIF